jgi:hypothetical protein
MEDMLRYLSIIYPYASDAPHELFFGDSSFPTEPKKSWLLHVGEGEGVLHNQARVFIIAS